MDSTITDGLPQPPRWAVAATMLAMLVAARLCAAQGPGGREIVVDVCTVVFAEEVDVPALESGALVEVNIAENQPLETGQTIARLDPATLVIRRRAAELRRTRLAEKMADDTEQRYADTVYEEAQIEHEMNLRQAQKSPGTVTQDTLRRSKLALERADLERQRVRKQRRDTEIELALQQAELDVIDDHLRRLEVTSPLSGVVLEMHGNRGEWVGAGEPVARVGRMDRLKITARLSESELSPRRVVGVPVAVRWAETEGVQHTLRGRVASVDPQMFDGGYYRLHVMVDNRRLDDGWLLTPGRQVVMTLYPSASPEEPVSPATARRLETDAGLQR